MKYFTIFAFLLLSIAAAAQLNMEEISFSPAPSGYYNNLIIKGNANINKMELKQSFNVTSYASFLNLNVSDSSNLNISTLTVQSSGTVAIFNEFSSNQMNMLPAQSKSGANTLVNIGMTGGTLSASGTTANNTGVVNIQTINFVPNENVTLTVRTQDIDYNDTNVDVMSTEFYIMGMKVPACLHGYFWQPVYIDTLQSYQVLACHTVETTCNPFDTVNEESCIHLNRCWDPATCECNNCN